MAIHHFSNIPSGHVSGPGENCSSWNRSRSIWMFPGDALGKPQEDLSTIIVAAPRQRDLEFFVRRRICPFVAIEPVEVAYSLCRTKVVSKTFANLSM